MEYMPGEITSICRLPGTRRWGVFRNPKEFLSASTATEVPEILEHIEKRTSEGYYAAGFVSFESSTAFDSALKVKICNGFPYCWFALFKRKPTTFHPKLDIPLPSTIEMSPETTMREYIDSVTQIKTLIYEGDTYQVNYTFRFHAGRISDPLALFHYFFRVHNVPYTAYFDTGDFQVVSVSPELFIERNTHTIMTRPMKGTAKRKLSFAADRETLKDLRLDMKNRAENVMITDMMRNDLGKICHHGSVKTTELFNVETYPTVHQMTSEVRGTLLDGTGMRDIFRACFPASSITGAPKVRTVQIIDSLEKSPRKIYTGTAGCFMPGGDFCLNVAIRTLICEKDRTEIGVGSGIVADSVPEEEWSETILKSDFVNYRPPEFDVIETILWERISGFKFLREHLARMRNSQKYFCRPWKRAAVLECIDGISFQEDAEFARVRLQILQDGQAICEVRKLDHMGWNRDILRLTISQSIRFSDDVFLYHKTTVRDSYDREHMNALSAGFDEVIFLNERDEVTEGAISSIFIQYGGKWLTPKLDCGLLPGIWRAKMIKDLDADESVFGLHELASAARIIVGNSVRGTCDALLVPGVG